VFPVRYELNLYVLLISSLSLKGLKTNKASCQGTNLLAHNKLLNIFVIH
jgi:hypothetical protein